MKCVYARCSRLQLPEWVQRLTDLEEERDRLQLQLQALQRAQQQQQEGSGANTSSSGGAAGAGEQQLFELRLQRDQAQAAARRLRARISELFGPEAADDNAPAVAGPGPSSTGARGGGGGTQQQRSANTGAAAKQASAREAELLATVTSLKDALEKAMAMSTPTSKFMQVCGPGWGAEEREARGAPQGGEWGNGLHGG